MRLSRPGWNEALRTLRDAPESVSLLITNVPAHFLEFAETLPVHLRCHVSRSRRWRTVSAAAARFASRSVPAT